MKKILYVLCLGLVFWGCNSNDSEIEELKKEVEELKNQKSQDSKEQAKDEIETRSDVTDVVSPDVSSGEIKKIDNEFGDGNIPSNTDISVENIIK